MTKTLVSAAAVVAALQPQPAHAFTTAVHIAIANDVRDALLDSGDGSIPLHQTDQHVQLAEQDAQAIVDHPFEFRAGAIGPDSFVFPGLTELTHGLGLDPYTQCQLLLDEAEDDAQRAYALGCFLHGSTDAVAHHYVNWLTGETFTLNPISASRGFSVRNASRHISAETMIQDAMLELQPDAFEAAAMLHTFPHDFAVRVYYDTDSPVWQAMAIHALDALDAAAAANPDGDLLDHLLASELDPAEGVVLLPMYTAFLDAELDVFRAEMEGEVLRLQDPLDPDGAELGVAPGDDGLLGTGDDSTACDVTCPTLYVSYFTYVGLLEPRQAKDGSPLPAAWDVLADDLRASLTVLPDAMVDTIQAVTVLLNPPLGPGGKGPHLDKAALREGMQPAYLWLEQLTDIDWDVLVEALAPEWLVDFTDALDAIGIEFSVTGVVEQLAQATIDLVVYGIEELVLDGVLLHLDEITADLEALGEGTEREFADRLGDAAPDGVDGDIRSWLLDSGLYGAAFNLTAAGLAERAVLLPQGADHGGLGPASFDASHTLAWTQATACPDLTPHLFPLGHDLDGLLSAQLDGTVYAGRAGVDSPVECHDGALDAFTSTPTEPTCAVTDLEALVADPAHQGSVSRAWPPGAIGADVPCVLDTIPGLELDSPADTDDTGTTSDTGETEETEPPPDTGADTGTPAADTGAEPAGCGCSSGPPPVALAWLAAMLAAARRRRWLAGAALVAGCGGEPDSAEPAAPTTGTPPPTTDTETTPPDTSPPPDTGDSGDSSDTADTEEPEPTPADELLAALDGKVWSGTYERDGVPRALEQWFDAELRLWVEVRNPWGPARLREMRVLSVAEDGETLHTLVSTPGGWEDNPNEGQTATWSVRVEGDELVLTGDMGEERYGPGAWAPPETGLTAVVRAFEEDDEVDEALCGRSASGFDYDVLFAFARGETLSPPLAVDVVAGVPTTRWTVGPGPAAADIPGLDLHGGTELVVPDRYIVTYLGGLVHPGGVLAMKEEDDGVDGALWVFLDDDVGSPSTADLFLEVHSFAWPDLTDDLVARDLGKGTVPIEAMVVRCDDDYVRGIGLKIGWSGSFVDLDAAVTVPDLAPELFPTPW